jgi:hypothetical protein
MKHCEIEYNLPPGPENKRGLLPAGFAIQALSLGVLAKKQVQSHLWVDLDFH